MYRNLSKQEQRTAKTSKTCCKSNVQIRGCSLFVYPEQTSSVGISQACSRWPSFLFFPAVNIVLCQWLAITDNGCNFGRRAHGHYQTFNKHAHTYLCSASPYTDSLRHVFDISEWFCMPTDSCKGSCSCRFLQMLEKSREGHHWLLHCLHAAQVHTRAAYSRGC